MAAPTAILMNVAASLLMVLLSPAPVSTIRSKGQLAKGRPSDVPSIPLMSAPGVPVLHGSNYLIISSPPNGKVFYTPVANGVSLSDEPEHLIDAGLTEPRGLAIDSKYGNLYVADTGAQRIYRYGLLVENGNLVTNGIRTTVVTNATVDSVAVDLEGNLFYTAGSTNNINKLPYKVIKLLSAAALEVTALEIVSAKEMMGEAAGEAANELKKPTVEILSEGPTDAPGADTEPYIYSMYEAEINPYVTEPGAIAVDGPALFWTNKANGTKAGSVVQGEVDPQPPLTGNLSAIEPFPAIALTSVSETAYGMAKTQNSVFWTTNESAEDTGVIYGQPLRGGDPMKYVEGLATPKGLAWDNDATVYVADDKTNLVSAFPIGRQMQNAPLSRTVAVDGAYGLALLRSDMPGFTSLQVQGNSAAYGYRSLRVLMSAALMAMIAASHSF
mmetsp:Transcript_99079/g.171748  ORF Transcript_99079/g.171748 Transcript_99079/m.171748 type:complete len:442 (-) Transcript_99079:40-1365(-)